ncbi:MAG: prolyl oligopeptidase family serine peptidase [Rhodothermaceae bacterium]|nr:prolyl oligopeptidase family serine peptidase [Rhodothermaceae bacterium]
MRVFSLSVLLVVTLAACDSSLTEPPPPLPPGGDEIVEGVNLTRLFATPSAEEHDAVRAEWATRDANRSGRYRYTIEATGMDSDGAALTVLAGRDAATKAVLHYGLVRVPGHAGEVFSLPTLLLCPEGLATATESDLLRDASYGFVRDGSVQVLMTYRGGTLSALGQTFASAAEPDAYDRDVDDALALIDAVLAQISRTDANRMGAYGFGRGGAVALVAGIRDERIRAVADLAGPSDFLSEPFRDEARKLLRGQNSAFPADASLAEQLFIPLREGTLTFEAARIALLRRSARPFALDLPANLIVHGTSDFTVPITFSRLLAQTILGLRPDGAPSVFLEVDASHTDLLTLSEAQQAVGAFFDAEIRTL